MCRTQNMNKSITEGVRVFSFGVNWLCVMNEMKALLIVLLHIVTIYCVNITNHNYCLRFRSLRGLSKSTAQHAIPGVLYHAWPGHRFTENCSAPDRITIHSRNRKYKIKNLGLKSHFAPDTIGHAWLHADVIVLNRFYKYGVKSRIRMTDRESNGTRTNDWCFITKNDTWRDGCLSCYMYSEYSQTLCSIYSVGLDFVIAHEIGHIIGKPHTASGVMRRRLRQVNEPMVTELSDIINMP